MAIMNMLPGGGGNVSDEFPPFIIQNTTSGIGDTTMYSLVYKKVTSSSSANYGRYNIGNGSKNISASESNATNISAFLQTALIKPLKEIKLYYGASDPQEKATLSPNNEYYFKLVIISGQFVSTARLNLYDSSDNIVVSNIWSYTISSGTVPFTTNLFIG